MRRILNFFLRLLNRFNYQEELLELDSITESNSNNIPNDIDDKEKIARFIFTPINVNPNSGKLKSNAYKPPAGYDEISVNRLDFTNADFLKKIAVKMQNPNSSRNYFGFGIISQSLKTHFLSF